MGPGARPRRDVPGQPGWRRREPCRRPPTPPSGTSRSAATSSRSAPRTPTAPPRPPPSSAPPPRHHRRRRRRATRRPPSAPSPTLTNPEDVAEGPIAFTVGDAQTSPGALVVTVASSNQTLVPAVRPHPGRDRDQPDAHDHPGGSSERLVDHHRVGQRRDGHHEHHLRAELHRCEPRPPTVSEVANQTTTSGQIVGPLTVTVGDVETAPGSLSVTAASSNATLVPAANLVVLVAAAPPARSRSSRRPGRPARPPSR